MSVSTAAAIESEMPENGVIFSDGQLEDRPDFQ